MCVHLILEIYLFIYLEKSDAWCKNVIWFLNLSFKRSQIFVTRKSFNATIEAQPREIPVTDRWRVDEWERERGEICARNYIGSRSCYAHAKRVACGERESKKRQTNNLLRNLCSSIHRTQINLWKYQEIVYKWYIQYIPHVQIFLSVSLHASICASNVIEQSVNWPQRPPATHESVVHRVNYYCRSIRYNDLPIRNFTLKQYWILSFSRKLVNVWMM